MMMVSVRSLVVLVFITTFPTHLLADPMVVEAPNYPLYYFAERIATDSFDIQYRVPADIDPAFWKPADADLVAFQRADIILRNGAKYSQWMHHASLPSSTIVDTTREIRDRFIDTEGELHSHGDGKVHSHGGVAFTTWMDFRQAIAQANAIARRFRAMKPSEAEEIDANFEKLKSDLQQLDTEAKAIGEKLAGLPLVASHPVYQYFSRAYGLKMKELEWEPSMEITAKHQSEMQAVLAEHPAKWMVWEGTPTTENVDVLKKMGLESVVVAPAGNRPESGDFLTVMKENLQVLKGMAE